MDMVVEGAYDMPADAEEMGSWAVEAPAGAPEPMPEPNVEAMTQKSEMAEAQDTAQYGLKIIRDAYIRIETENYDADVEQLRAAEAALDRCAREGDALRLYQAEIQLHRTVLAACKNTQLERMAANLLDQESVFRYRSMLMDETRGADSLREHKAIVQAVIRRDEEGAERLAREHVHKLLQWVRRTQQPSLSQAASPLRPLSRE